MKITVKFIVTILVLFIMILTIQLYTLQKTVSEMKGSYELQVDSISTVIEKYRINDGDRIFLTMYHNMQQSNRLIDHYLHIQELDIIDLKQITNELYKTEFNKDYLPWDDHIHTDEFHEKMNDPNLITNQFR
jgi:hypothetical protein